MIKLITLVANRQPEASLKNKAMLEDLDLLEQIILKRHQSLKEKSSPYHLGLLFFISFNVK